MCISEIISQPSTTPARAHWDAEYEGSIKIVLFYVCSVPTEIKKWKKIKWKASFSHYEKKKDESKETKVKHKVVNKVK